MDTPLSPSMTKLDDGTPFFMNPHRSAEVNARHLNIANKFAERNRQRTEYLLHGKGSDGTLLHHFRELDQRAA